MIQIGNVSAHQKDNFLEIFIYHRRSLFWPRGSEIKEPLLTNCIHFFWDTLYLARTISQLRVINQNPSSLENNEPLINGVH